MVSVFGDDSADETKQRVFAIAGVLATEEEWTRIEEQWTAKCDGIPFHATDCDSNQGQYAGRSHEENKQLYKELVQLVVNSNAWGFGAALDLVGFAAWYPDVPGEISYYKAFYETVARLAYVARDVFKDEVKFTFDNRVQSNFTAGLIYESMLNNFAPDAPRLADKLTFASARTNVRIQVGDLYAREVMKELDNRIGPQKRPRRHSMAALVETKRFGCDLLLAEYFEDLRRRTEEIETKDDEFNRRKYRAWLEASRLPDTIQNRFKFVWFVTREDANYPSR